MEGEPLDSEDGKLVTLARATRTRTGAVEGAAIRDTIGRTYTAGTVALPSLSVSALRLAVAMAASSGADGLEAAVLLGERLGAAAPGGDGSVPAADMDAVRDLGGTGVPVIIADPDGTVTGTART